LSYVLAQYAGEAWDTYIKNHASALLAHGFQHRKSILHALGNAIVPQVGAEFIKAYMSIGE